MVRSPDWKPKFDDPEIQTYIETVGGEMGMRVFAHILETEPVSGVDILEAFEEEKPSDVRKALYKLMQEHALEYHKDTDASGWETFIWATDLPELGLIHVRAWKEELRQLRKRHKWESDHEYYACENGHGRQIFELAMDAGFHCPECDAPMQPADNSHILAELETRIHELAAALEG